MGPLGCPEKSVMNYHLTLHYIPVESSEGYIFSDFFYIHLFVFNSCVTKPSLFFHGQNGTDCSLSLVCSFFVATSEEKYDILSRGNIAEVTQWHSLFNIPQQLTEDTGERNVGTVKDQ